MSWYRLKINLLWYGLDMLRCMVRWGKTNPGLFQDINTMFKKEDRRTLCTGYNFGALAPSQLASAPVNPVQAV
jgi:hypothetical protein